MAAAQINRALDFVRDAFREAGVLWWRFFDWLALIEWRQLYLVWFLVFVTGLFIKLTEPAIWFILISFGVKVLAGGKRRAELLARDASTKADVANLERRLTEAQMATLQAQVEPHFLFNTLANLKYLIRTDQRAAQEMLDHLVGYLQNAMPDMRSVSSTLGREMDLVSDYLAVMRIRMGTRLRYAVEVAEELRSLPFPPAMLISLVENAVKHGLERASRPGLITISARHESDSTDGLLSVSVVDDGVGLTEQSGQGTGLANITERLLLLYGRKAGLFVAPGDGQGVCAVLTVPIVGSHA